MNGAPNRCGCGAGTAPTRLFDIASPTSLARSTLMRCTACGSLFPETLPSPPEAERLYDISVEKRPRWRRAARGIVDLTRRRYLDRATPLTARRILDFGCGAGGYLARVAAPGRESFGTDPLGTSEGGQAWRRIAAEEMEGFGPFDWITLGHVLEHLDEPARVLSRLVTALAPGGGLWIATPNADSFMFGVAGGATRDVDYPRHREIFARSGLRKRLEAVGLTTTFVSPPRVNAVLNVVTTAGQVIAARGQPLPRRFSTWAKLWLALAAHLLKPRRYRDAESPELIVLCRITPEGPFPVR